MLDKLYKNKTIRDFLSFYPEAKWVELVTLVLEYGIITFKKHHNCATMTIEDISSVIEVFKNDNNILTKRPKTNKAKVLKVSNSKEKYCGKLSSNSKAQEKPRSSVTPTRAYSVEKKLEERKANSKDKPNLNIKSSCGLRISKNSPRVPTCIVQSKRKEVPTKPKLLKAKSKPDNLKKKKPCMLLGSIQSSIDNESKIKRDSKNKASKVSTKKKQKLKTKQLIDKSKDRPFDKLINPYINSLESVKEKYLENNFKDNLVSKQEQDDDLSLAEFMMYEQERKKTIDEYKMHLQQYENIVDQMSNHDKDDGNNSLSDYHRSKNMFDRSLSKKSFGNFDQMINICDNLEFKKGDM